MKIKEKKILIYIFAFLIVFMLLSIFWIIIKKSQVDTKIYAATAFYEKTEKWADIYNKQRNTNIGTFMTSTSEAFKKIIEGKADIVIVSMPSDSQKKLLEKSRDDIVFEKYYEASLAFYVNEQNPIEELRSEQISEIYGYSNTWNKYGWSDNNDRITTYQLEKDNGSQTAFENFFVKDNHIDDVHKEVKYMEEIIESVGKDKNGIAYAFFSYYNGMHGRYNTKTLKVDGYYPEEDNYTIKIDVFIVYKSKNKEQLKDVIEGLYLYEDVN